MVAVATKKAKSTSQQEAKEPSLHLSGFASGSKQTRRKIVARGIGSGRGKTAGRGHKGQKSRTGGKVPIWV